MKVLHVGGLHLFKYKTLSEAIDHAKAGDVIHIHKTIKESVTIYKPLTIIGHHHKWVCEQGAAAITTYAKCHISQLRFVLHSHANAILSHDSLILEELQMTYQNKLTEWYPMIYHDNKTRTRKHSKIGKIYADEHTVCEFDHVEFTPYFGDSVYHSESQIQLLGKSLFEHCQLSHILATDAEVIQSSFTSYNTFSRLKTECSLLDPPPNPTRDEGVLPYCVRILDVGEVISYDTATPYTSGWIGMIGNGELYIKDVSHPKGRCKHLIQSGSVSFIHCVDGNKWDIKGTSAFVQSQVNTNIKRKSALKQLDEMIGLHEVKKQLRNIIQTIKMGQLQHSPYTMSYHMIFAGHAGTGKTTVAKLMSQALFEAGLLPKQKLTQVSADSLVKGYVGQTAQHVRNVLDKALGGVLFIDEAYQLTVKDDQHTFNDEVLSVLIRYMEEHREELVVIAAGYPDEMREFLQSNQGLARRFNWIPFDDYTLEEMLQIYEVIQDSYQDHFSSDQLLLVVKQRLYELVELYKHHTSSNGGNGGLIRNIYQQIVMARNDRVLSRNKLDLSITEEDIHKGFDAEMTKLYHILKLTEA